MFMIKLKQQIKGEISHSLPNPTSQRYGSGFTAGIREQEAGRGPAFQRQPSVPAIS